MCFGYGAAAPGESYPAIYIVGWVNNVYGVWQSINNAQSWTQIGTWPNNSLDTITTISGDPGIYGQVYVGFAGSGAAYLPARAARFSRSGFAIKRHRGHRQHDHYNPHDDRGGDRHRHPNALAQRRRHRDLYRRVRHRRADLQLHRSRQPTAMSRHWRSLKRICRMAQPSRLKRHSAAIFRRVDDLLRSANRYPSPQVQSIVESPSSGDLNSGKTVTLTLDMSEAVTVNTPAARRR